MDVTEMVSKVVVEARRNSRRRSSFDEQAWFDAGEPDTVPDVPRQPRAARDPDRAAPTWALIAALCVLASIGFAIGLRLAQQ